MDTKQTITKWQLHILRHSIGLDDTGRGKEYRNHYAISPSCDGWADVQVLLSKGLMHDAGPTSMWGGLHRLTVTEAGKVIARQTDQLPKMSKSQKRYRAFLNADCGLRFGEWLKTDWAKNLEL